MNLVVDHVAQTLVVRGAQEDLGAQLLARVAIVHDLEATRLVACGKQERRDGCDCDAGEWGSVAFCALEGADFGEQTLDQVSNCHTRRNSVWVDDEIWSKTFACEWHVFLTICHTNGTFLSVS